MKTAIAAIQGMSTHELTELADKVWCAQKCQDESTSRLRKAENWQLAEAAEQMSRQNTQESQERSDVRASAVTPVRRPNSIFKRLWQAMKNLLRLVTPSYPSIPPTEKHASDSANEAEPEAASNQVSETEAREMTRAEGAVVQELSPEINLKNLNRYVRDVVGQTIIGRVTLEMVLAELERRGYPYRPPITGDGTLVIRECDLTNEARGTFRKVRPGIDRLLREGEYGNIRVETSSPVRIDHSVEGPNLQFESSSALSLPALWAKAVISPHIRVDKKCEAQRVKTKKLECRDLEAEIVEAVDLCVDRDADVKHLDVSGDVSIGSKLDGTHSIRVRGKATMGSLGDNIPGSCKVKGKSIAAVFRERTGQIQSSEDDPLRPGVTGSADHRIEAAFALLNSHDRPISPSRLARRSSTNYVSAKRWLKEHHPEYLATDRNELAEVTGAPGGGASVTFVEKLKHVVSPKTGSGDLVQQIPKERSSHGMRWP